MTVYQGRRDDFGMALVLVVRQGAGDPTVRQLVRTKHVSPVGYEWGYSGVGPYELAHAILTDHFGGTDEAAAKADVLAGAFVERFVRRWSTKEFTIDTLILNECLSILHRDSGVKTPPGFCELQERVAS